jgi:uncharacterized protein (TIGR02597 family)
MKSTITYSLLAAAAACGVASAQTTAYTTPVGYVTVTVPAQTDTPISLPLERPAVFSGASTGISGNVISVAANSFAASAYVYSNPAQTNTYMVQVSSGSLAGRSFKVTGNGTGSVTVDPVGDQTLEVQGFASTDNIVIRPYWTLNTLLPAGGAIGPSPFDNPGSQVFFTVNSPTEAVGVNRSSTSQFYYDDGSDNTFPFDGTPQWADQNFSAANDNIIDPSNGLAIRNVSASPLSIVVTGTVPSISNSALVVSSVQSNDHVVQQPYPVDITLNGSQLAQSGAVKPTTDWTSPTDLVLVYNPEATGFNPSAAKVYNYITDPAFADDFGLPVPGWYDSSFAPANDDVLPFAGGIVIRKEPGASFQANTWKAPLPYTNP